MLYAHECRGCRFNNNNCPIGPGQPCYKIHPPLNIIKRNDERPMSNNMRELLLEQSLKSAQALDKKLRGRA
jgi:hypothetical protein